MSDYISREAVLMQLCNRHCATDPAECLFKITHNGDPGCFTADDILKIPAADVRPVVLCRDCIHLRFKDFNGICNGPMCGIVKPWDYCSHGAKMGGDT